MELNNKKMIGFGLLFFCLFCQGMIYGLDVYVSLDVEDEFIENQMIEFNYIISSDENTNLEIIPNIICENAPQAMLEIIPVELNEQNDRSYSGTYTYIQVKDIEPQTCTASVNVIDPSKLANKTFKISINPKLKIELYTYKDLDYTQKTKVFIKNEKIYINYKDATGNQNPSTIKGTIFYPDGTIKSINDLPTSIDAQSIGSYSLEVNAAKDGYQTTSAFIEFAVIEKEIKIQKKIITCNNNLICDSGENHNNCPNDCPSGTRDNYCDKISDGICDPDCSEIEDVDCIITEPVPNIHRGISSGIDTLIFVILITCMITLLVLWVIKKKKHQA